MSAIHSLPHGRFADCLGKFVRFGLMMGMLGFVGQGVLPAATTTGPSNSQGGPVGVNSAQAGGGTSLPKAVVPKATPKATVAPQKVPKVFVPPKAVPGSPATVTPKNTSPGPGGVGGARRQFRAPVGGGTPKIDPGKVVPQIDQRAFDPNRQSEQQRRMQPVMPSQRSQGNAAKDIFKRAKQQRAEKEVEEDPPAPKPTTRRQVNDDKPIVPNIDKLPEAKPKINQVGNSEKSGVNVQGATATGDGKPAPKVDLDQVDGPPGKPDETPIMVGTADGQSATLEADGPQKAVFVDGVAKSDQLPGLPNGPVINPPKQTPKAPGSADQLDQWGRGRGDWGLDGFGNHTGGGRGQWEGGLQMPGGLDVGRLEEMAWADDSHTPVGGAQHSPAGTLGDVGGVLQVGGGFVPGAAGSAMGLIGGVFQAADKGSVGDALTGATGTGGYGIGKFIDYGVSGKESDFQGGAKELGDKAGSFGVGLLGVVVAVGLGAVGLGFLGVLVVGVAKATGADEIVGGWISGGVQSGAGHVKDAVTGTERNSEGKTSEEVGAELDSLQKEADQSAQEGEAAAKQAEADQAAQEKADADKKAAEEKKAEEKKEEEEAGDDGGDDDDDGGDDDTAGGTETSPDCPDTEEGGNGPGILTQEDAQMLNEKMGRDVTGEHRDADGPMDLEGFDPNQTNALTGESSNILDGNKARLSPEQMKDMLFGGEVKPCPVDNLDIAKF